VLKNDDTHYVFFGSALAVAASVDRPVKDFLTEQTSVVLSPSGGYAVQTREQTNFREIIRTGRVNATVIGDADAGDHISTLATTTIENLDILGFIKADAIVSRLTAVYKKGGEDDGVMHPTTFHIHGSAFYGLKIDGKHHDISVERCAVDIPKDPNGRHIYTVDENSGYRLTAAGVGTKRLVVMDVAELGRIVLVEFDVFKGRANLTMLRVEFGCTIKGTGSVGVTCTNGHKGP